MAGLPGSLSAYSKGERKWFTLQEGPGPGDYDVNTNSIGNREETVAPFDTSALRGQSRQQDGPGPDAYDPEKLPHRHYGSPLFRWKSRLPEKEDFSCSEPKWGRIPDPWERMTHEIFLTHTKRPRVPFEKFVSNNVPSVFHPLDIRCFVVGIDGRMYPWKLNRTNKLPGPKYNTYKVHTSYSKLPARVNFAAMSGRKELFPPKKGAGPADFIIRRNLHVDGGEFLGQKWDDPESSAPRLCEIEEKRARKENYPSPSNLILPGSFDKMSPKAVLAPFKSKTPLGFFKPKFGPGPTDHFFVKMEECDLKQRLDPGLITCPPPKAPFETSQYRFAGTEITEQRPSPSDYDIMGFTDRMQYDVKRHPAAIPNPKLGFLISSEARPERKDMGELCIGSVADPPKKWKNLRPRKCQTYGYNGAPPKYPDSPGPIYDTNPGAAAIKAKKSWWDPRHPTHSGFLNSGCSVSRMNFRIDKDIPGVGYYYSKLPKYQRHPGIVPCPGPRFKTTVSDSPGPVHKLHEKYDSSIWRSTHLGTHNAYLKQVGVLFPWAGGFRKRNLTAAGDTAWHITREDDYSQVLCPTAFRNSKKTCLGCPKT